MRVTLQGEANYHSSPVLVRNGRDIAHVWLIKNGEFCQQGETFVNHSKNGVTVAPHLSVSILYIHVASLGYISLHHILTTVYVAGRKLKTTGVCGDRSFCQQLCLPVHHAIYIPVHVHVDHHSLHTGPRSDCTCISKLACCVASVCISLPVGVSLL